MQLFDYLLHVHEVIMYTSLFDECCLISGDEVVKLRTEPIHQILRNDLGEAVNQAYWLVICYGFRERFFRYQNTT
jgi:hypothetical protein